MLKILQIRWHVVYCLLSSQCWLYFLDSLQCDWTYLLEYVRRNKQTSQQVLLDNDRVVAIIFWRLGNHLCLWMWMKGVTLILDHFKISFLLTNLPRRSPLLSCQQRPPCHTSLDTKEHSSTASSLGYLRSCFRVYHFFMTL